MSANQFEYKIDHLFERKRKQASSFNKTTEDTCEETKDQLKYLPFNVSTVIKQIQEETERRAKTLKRGARDTNNEHE